MKHGGLVTAAGASRRMGSPKALLRQHAEGPPLAEVQARKLQRAGCTEVVVVLGCAAQRIAAELGACRVATNPDWAQGRLTSVVCGLRALPPCDGYLLMPVDAAGIRPPTCAALLQHAAGKQVLRATYHGQPGHLVWLSSVVKDELLSADLPPDTPLNEWLRPRTEWLEIDDAGLVQNLNTPEDWQRFLADPDPVAGESL